MRHLVLLSAVIAAPVFAQQGISESHMTSIRSAATECGAVVSSTRRGDTVVMTIRAQFARPSRIAGVIVCPGRIPATRTSYPYAVSTQASNTMFSRIYDWLGSVPNTPVILETRSSDASVIYQRTFASGTARAADIRTLRAALQGA